MRRIPLRWALPVFHIAMDAVLVAIFVVMLQYASPAIARFRTGPFLPASYDQNVTMVIDPLQEPCLLLLTTANLPAGMITLLALSTTRDKLLIPYDSRGFLWVGFYESLAVAFWFFLSRTPSAHWWNVASMFVRNVAC
jgi:hypothetical protein